MKEFKKARMEEEDKADNGQDLVLDSTNVIYIKMRQLIKTWILIMNI